MQGFISRFILKTGQRISNFINLQKFICKKTWPKSVLLLELNGFHTELMPSYVKYLKQAKYDVDIAVNLEHKGFLPKIDAKNIFYFTPKGFKKFFNTKKIKEYDFLIFTSYRLYWPILEQNKAFQKVFEAFNIKYQPKKGVIFTLHNLEDYDDIIKKSKGAIVLSDILNKEENLYTVNPCYFIENNIKEKNNKTKFIIAGSLETKRRNPKILYDAIQRLLDEKNNNFEISIVGDNKTEDIPSNLRNFIKIKGRLGFDDMYKELSTADFFLPLLDPDNKEHLRYITTGTSGSFQLIRGFLLPGVIHKTFAIPHKFNSSNSIIYENNEDFYGAISKCINMEKEDYKKLQTSLLNSRDEIMNNSFNNLAALLNKY